MTFNPLSGRVVQLRLTDRNYLDFISRCIVEIKLIVVIQFDNLRDKKKCITYNHQDVVYEVYLFKCVFISSSYVNSSFAFISFLYYFINNKKFFIIKFLYQEHDTKNRISIVNTILRIFRSIFTHCICNFTL